MSTKTMPSNLSRHSLSATQFTASIILLLLSLLLAGCSEKVEPEDTWYTSQVFSVNLETFENQIQADLTVINPGDSEFPGESDFNGKAKLWNQSGELSLFAEVDFLPVISPGETREVASLNWSLDPGVYFLSWGEPEYGGVLNVITVEYRSGNPEAVRLNSFNTKPADYGSDFRSCGSITTFSIAEDEGIFVAGETPLPDQGCILPLLYSRGGLVEGFPNGVCVPITDGQWQLEVPADPGGAGVHLEEGLSYQVIAFGSDLRVPPSEPFEINISPPVQE